MNLILLLMLVSGLVIILIWLELEERREKRKAVS